MRLGCGIGVSSPMVLRQGGPGSINLIEDSWQFSHTGVFWNGENPNLDITLFQSDPMGDAKAELWEAPPGGAAAVQESSDNFSGSLFAPYDDITVSLYLKYHSGTFGGGNFRLYNMTVGGTPGTARLNYGLSGGVFTITNVTGDEVYAVESESLADDWYRISMRIDLATNRASNGWQDTDVYDCRVVPFGTDPDDDLGIYAFGYQLNPGTVPTAYVEKP